MPDSMHLYAAGFNAMGQLSALEKRPQWQEKPLGRQIGEPNDLSDFTKILSGESIGPPRVGMFFTDVQCDNEALVAGSGWDTASRDHVGDWMENGDSLTYDQSPGSPLKFWKHRVGYTKGAEPDREWARGDVMQIVAYATGFVILYADGLVETMGDPRVEACLGRVVDAEHAAETPCLVKDLADLGRVCGVRASGYTIVALAESGDLYIWGQNFRGKHRTRQAFSDLTGVPNYCEVDGEKEVRDVVLGDSHAVAITTDGHLYGVGSNENGQLGLGVNKEGLDAWTKLAFGVAEGHEIVGLTAGPRSTFIRTAAAAKPARR